MAELWFEKTVEDIASRFKTDLTLGLTEAKAAQRLKDVGLNLLSKQKKTSPLVIFSQQFSSVVTWVLLAAVIVSFFRIKLYPIVFQN